MSEATRKNVSWRTSEIQEVARAIEQNTKNHPHWTLINVIRLSEEQALGPERQRAHKFPAMYGRRCYQLFKDAYNRGLEQATLVLNSPKPEPKREPAPTPEPVKAPESEVKQDRVESLEAMATAAIVGELFVRLTKLVVERVELRLDRIEQAVIDSFLTKNGSSQPRPPAMALVTKERIKPRQPVLTVVGLKRDQFEHLKAKCSETCFELRWEDAEQKHPSFPHTDYIVIQRHIGHGWWEAAQAKVPSDRLAFSGGGISETVQRVYDFHAKELNTSSRR